MACFLNGAIFPVLLALIAMVFSLQFGANELSLSAALRSNADPFLINMILSIRLPRVLLATMCGASLAAAGVVSQGLFRNPLASPGIIGVSSAASSAVCLILLWGGAKLVGASSGCNCRISSGAR